MKRLVSGQGLAWLGILLCLVFMSSATAMAGSSSNTWTVPGDFASLQEAIDDDSVMPGDTIRVGPGFFAGAEVTKGVHIKGVGQAVINAGPDFGFADLQQGFRLLEGSDGASFSNLTFTVGLGIYSRAVNGVTIEHCRFEDPFQAITNWGGSDWLIRHNTTVNVITLGLEGGIGGTPIVIGAREGAATAQNNLLAHNRVTGQVLFDPADDGTEGDIWGILIAAVETDLAVVSGNQVLHNKVSLVSTDPSLRETVGLVLADLLPDPEVPAPCQVVYDNAVKFNDLRGPNDPLQVIPSELEACNDISFNR